MSIFPSLDFFDSWNSLFYREISLFKPISPTFFHPPISPHQQLPFTLDLPNPSPISPSPTDLFESSCLDLIHFQRYRPLDTTNLYLQSLCDRVSALELSFDQLIHEKINGGDHRKYRWKVEIKGPEMEEEKKRGVDRKYKAVAEIKADGDESYKWTAEIKGKGREDCPISRTYTFTASTEKSGKDEKRKSSKDSTKESNRPKSRTRVVEIEETNHAAVALKKV